MKYLREERSLRIIYVRKHFWRLIDCVMTKWEEDFGDVDHQERFVV